MTDETTDETPDRRVLLVDDHHEMVELLASRLREHDWTPICADGGREAIEKMDETLPDIVVTDLRMEEIDGMDVLREALDRDPDLPVIVMTAFGDIESAVEAIKAGGFHYMSKPFDFDELHVYLKRALEHRRLQRTNRAFRKMNADESGLEQLIGQSDPMVKLRETIKRVAQTDAPALIRGDSGTGKELVARAIHTSSLRGAEPFVPINCTVLPPNLLASELFGHRKGAFTGADTARDGLFLEADGGTLFLDEIGDMPHELQGKLLRVLENHEIRPVGADTTTSVDVRILAATHRDLEASVESGDFREDLYYRLNVVPVRVPPLHERRDDIPLLIDHFIDDAQSRQSQSPVENFDDELTDHLRHRRWPGNVRQLKNVVERIVALGDASTVSLEEYRSLDPDAEQTRMAFPSDPDQLQSLDRVTDAYIQWVVDRCDGNKSRAAEILEIDPSTIHRRLDD